MIDFRLSLVVGLVQWYLCLCHEHTRHNSTSNCRGSKSASVEFRTPLPRFSYIVQSVVMDW